MVKTLASLLILSTLAGPVPAADGPSDRTYTITLGPRNACATPKTTRQARAEGGATEVTTASSNVLAVTMSGSVAANAFLGHTSTASMNFHVEQEFEITCSDPAATFVKMTMESALVGFVRAKHKASASVKLASAKICLPGSGETPFVIIHPTQGVEGDDGRLCNQHLPPIKVDRMPLGRYVLVADFIMAVEAGGVLDGHSAVDFSPSTSLPTDWVRTRDPFQGVDKKDFGFKLLVTADPTDAPQALTSKGQDGKITQVKATVPTTTPVNPMTARPKPTLTGLDRHSGAR